MENQTNDLVHYVDVGTKYFRMRQLGKGANWLLLWGLAVAATMFAHLFGWNFGLMAGGFWGMVIATGVVALMYVGLVFSIAELSAALPYTGGFYAFTRYAFGPLGGLICGTAQAIQYLLMPAVIVGWLADYLSARKLGIPLELWWLVLYASFVLINILSTRLTLVMTGMFALLAICFLSFFYVSVWVTGAFDASSLFTLLPEQNQSTLLPKGWLGIFAALPFAIWFYLPLDLISLLAEETDNAQSSIPKALLGALFTLLPLSFLTLVVTSGVAGGVAVIGISQSPLLDGLQPILDEMSPGLGVMPLVAAVVLANLATLSITVAYSRVLFALSRAGYFPTSLSVTSSYQTPTIALIWGALVGLLSLYLAREIGGEGGHAVLANMVVFAAMLSVSLVMASYIKLKQEHADLPRPYTSPLGSWGAGYALLVAILTLTASFLNPDIRSGAVGVTLFLLVAILYFLFVSSQRLIAQAPEEELAPEYETDITAKEIANKIFVVLLSVAATYLFIRFGLAAAPCPPDCMGAYLIRENLSGADFRGTNLVFANLHEVDLSGADLREADLSGATLVGANLANADLSRAKLIGANLTEADLGGVILSYTDMSGANLNRANLTNVNLTTTRLRGVQLEGASLIGANLSGLDMAGARLANAIMKEANLSGTNLAGASFSLADLSGADLSGSNLIGAWLNESNLTDASLQHADLSGTSLIGANLTSANLSASQLVGSTLIGANFFGADLSGSVLSGGRWRISTLLEQELSPPHRTHLKPFHEQDADFSGVEFNSQTKWPSQEFTLAARAGTQTEARENAIKVGLLYSLSGALAVTELPVSQATLLAIDEINVAGGVLGKQLIPIVQDSAGTPHEFAEKASFLLEEEEVAVVFGGSRFHRPLNIFEELNGLLFYPFHYEGFERSPNLFYIGPDPTQQIIPAARYLLRRGFETIILLGTDDSFSHTANLIVKAVLRDAPAESQIQVVGEEYVPLEERDFSSIISQIKAAQPVVIFNSMAGQSNQAFFQQFKAARLTPQLSPVISVSVWESEVQQIGPSNIAGHFTVASYYQTHNSLENNLFVQAYKQADGPNHLTSGPIEAGYVAVYLWKEMVEKAGELSIDAVRAAAASSEIRYLAPSGLVRIDSETQGMYLKARVGLIREDGLIEEIASTDLKPPDPFLSQYDWGAELSRAIQNLKSQEFSR